MTAKIYHLPPRFKTVIIEPRITLESIARKAYEQPSDESREDFIEALNACQITYYGDVAELQKEPRI